MARKHKHEDHINHEAWAIPFGDLMTLLLAFFVVMYAISQVNEGKYRVLSDSLLQAFKPDPTADTMLPTRDPPKIASATCPSRRTRTDGRPLDTDLALQTATPSLA